MHVLDLLTIFILKRAVDYIFLMKTISKMLKKKKDVKCKERGTLFKILFFGVSRKQRNGWRQNTTEKRNRKLLRAARTTTTAAAPLPYRITRLNSFYFLGAALLPFSTREKIKRM